MWQGEATTLLAELEERVGERTVKLKSWPKDARSLSNKLRRLAPNLREAGIDIALDIREQGRVKRDAAVLMVGLTIAIAIGFLALLSIQTPRLLVFVFPLLYLALLRPRVLRPIGFVLVGLVLALSVQVYSGGEFQRVPTSEFWLYLNENPVELTGDAPLLLSSSPRHPYYFLSARTFIGELRWDLVMEHDGAFILGNREYQASRITELTNLAEQLGYTFSTTSLTPDYADSQGNAIVEVHTLEQKSP